MPTIRSAHGDGPTRPFTPCATASVPERATLRIYKVSAISLATIRSYCQIMPNSASIVVPTRSGQFALDMTHTAVIVVDMQNDFGSPGGMFERGGVDISGIRAAITPTARVLTQTRQAGGRIIYLKAGIPVEARSALLDSMSDFLSGFPPYAAHINSTVGQQVSAPDGSESCVMVR